MIPETPRRPGQGGGGRRSSGLVSQGETTSAANIITLRSGALDRNEVRARCAVYALVAEIDDALAAVSDGDIDAIFSAHILIGRAVKVVLDNGLQTQWDWRPGA